MLRAKPAIFCPDYSLFIFVASMSVLITKFEDRMRKLLSAVFILFIVNVYAQDSSKYISPDTVQHIIPGRANRPDQIKKPYVILISADGLRYDLADKYHAQNLIRLRTSGVNADYLQPVFPSLTFPNHY